MDNSASLTTVYNQLHHAPQAYEAAKDALREIGLNIPEKSEALPSVRASFNMAVATGEVDAYLDCGGEPTLEGGNGFISPSLTKLIERRSEEIDARVDSQGIR